MLPVRQKISRRLIIRIVFHPEFGMKRRGGDRLRQLLVSFDASDGCLAQQILERSEFGAVG